MVKIEESKDNIQESVLLGAYADSRHLEDENVVARAACGRLRPGGARGQRGGGGGGGVQRGGRGGMTSINAKFSTTAVQSSTGTCTVVLPYCRTAVQLYASGTD